MWVYRQSTGELSQDGVIMGYGWSGYDDGINVPGMDHLANRGPIPRGEWMVIGPPQDTLTHGPFVLRLAPWSHRLGVTAMTEISLDDQVYARYRIRELLPIEEDPEADDYLDEIEEEEEADDYLDEIEEEAAGE